MEIPELAALADPARWRIVSILAERPQSVGVVAERAELRQPQASKHLQTLERVGLVASQRSGQRRIYALEPGPLHDLAASLDRLAERADRHARARTDFDQYGAAMAAERDAAATDRWADGRVFTFVRRLAGARAVVWSAITESDRLAHWWVPDELRVARLIFEAAPGGRIVQEYADAADRSDVDGVVGRAEGVVEAVDPRSSVDFRLSPLLPSGEVAFTGHYTFGLSDVPSTTRGESTRGSERATPSTELQVRLGISGSVVDSADFIAGIELGWNQSLDRLAAMINSASADE